MVDRKFSFETSWGANYGADGTRFRLWGPSASRARARSVMFAVQLEDAVLSVRQPNLPGTTNEYPNWRIRSDVMLEDLAADPRFQTLTRAMREERPEITP